MAAKTGVSMPSVAMSIPVVDFEKVLSCSEGEGLASCGAVQELHSAFTTVGFVFIRNHGIDRRMIDRAFEVTTEFFTHSVKEKEKYARMGNDIHGYICLEKESVDPPRPGDLKECYNICELQNSQAYPDALVPSFKPTVTELFEGCMKLALKIVEAMGYALKLQDPQYFVKAHSKMGLGSDHNFTTLRLLYYPPLPPDREVKPGQLRCGEHVDYGSITLLFLDPSGGLQVKCSDHYIDVPYMPDAVLVNLGALMQQWTSDLYLATPHKVLIPEQETKKRALRQSLAFFVQPDNEVLVECIDGSGKYPPITVQEDTRRRMKRTYTY